MEPNENRANRCELADAVRKRPGTVRRLYDWTLHWAETPNAVWALFILAFAEASFFPVPPDVLLIAMALAAPKKSLRYAAVCSAGSVVGGCLGYAIGMFFFEAVGRPVLSFYHYLDQFHELSFRFAQHGFFFIFIAALTPIPYKVFTIAAGFCHADVSLGVLILASVIGRGLRFFVVGGLFRLFGPPIKRFIDRYFNLLTIAFMVLLVLGFLCVRILIDNSTEPPAPPEPGVPAERSKPAPAAHRTGQKAGEPQVLSQEARRTLLQIARQTVSAAVRGDPLPKPDVANPELAAHQGAFVTLKAGGQLRGCIGQFTGDVPLWQMVHEMAEASATKDHRFFDTPLSPAELPDLDIEISVLSPMERVNNPLEEVKLGEHGIYIKQGFSSGCFLPQVATETGWTKEEFLSRCCAGKAGLPPDAWRDASTEVYVFTAEVFGEEGPS